MKWTGRRRSSYRQQRKEQEDENMKQVLHKLAVGKANLTKDEARLAMETIMGGKEPAQAAAFLTALRMKGPTPEEIAAMALVMREKAVSIRPDRQPLVDTCGTGGDGKGTFNISTAAAIIAASCGVAIAKHGNRAMSGKSGSADVISELGIRMLQPPEVSSCIEKTGFGFMFAQLFHPAMKEVAPVRAALGFPTIFNLLGPLANPACAEAHVMGVFDEKLLDVMVQVHSDLGTKRLLVVHSAGMDEIGLGLTFARELRDGTQSRQQIYSAQLGLADGTVPKAESAQESAAIILGVLRGEEGPARSVCLLNAAAAVYVGGMADSIRDGLETARRAVDSGAAMGKLEEIRAFQ